MIVYVESNFILELAYLQEQHASCEELLALAQARKVLLALPAFSVTEARSSSPRRADRRRKFHDRLRRELRELSRSQPYQQLSSRTEALTTALIESGEAEKNRLDSVLSRLIGISELLPTQGSTVQSAIQYETILGLSPKDAVILASILEDMATRGIGPKCFLNRNSKDFANPDIYEELEKHDCKMLPSFTNGLAYVQGVIAKATERCRPQSARRRPRKK